MADRSLQDGNNSGWRNRWKVEEGTRPARLAGDQPLDSSYFRNPLPEGASSNMAETLPYESASIDANTWRQPGIAGRSVSDPVKRGHPQGQGSLMRSGRYNKASCSMPAIPSRSAERYSAAIGEERKPTGEDQASINFQKNLGFLVNSAHAPALAASFNGHAGLSASRNSPVGLSTGLYHSGSDGLTGLYSSGPAASQHDPNDLYSSDGFSPEFSASMRNVASALAAGPSASRRNSSTGLDSDNGFFAEPPTQGNGPLGQHTGLDTGLPAPRNNSTGLSNGLASPRNSSTGFSNRLSARSNSHPGLSNGLVSPRNGSAGLPNGLSAHSNGHPGLSNGLVSPRNGSAGLPNGLSARSNGHGLANGLSTRSNGHPGLSNGLVSPRNGSAGLPNGLSARSNGHGLANGLSARNNGHPGLSDGLVSPRNSSAGLSRGLASSRNNPGRTTGLSAPHNSQRRTGRPILGVRQDPPLDNKVAVRAAGELRAMRPPETTTQLLPQNQFFCTFCFKNKEPSELYTSHKVKDTWERVICPVLRSHRCEICGVDGDKAHTRKYCPLNKKPRRPQE